MTALLKFFHILLALSLFGSVIFSFILMCSKYYTKHHQRLISTINKSMLLFAVLALITGTFLVYPKHFNFQTPWIQAAYLLVLIFSITVAALISIPAQYKCKKWIYLFLIFILIIVVHDAVTKATILKL